MEGPFLASDPPLKAAWPAGHFLPLREMERLVSSGENPMRRGACRTWGTRGARRTRSPWSGPRTTTLSRGTGRQALRAKWRTRCHVDAEGLAVVAAKAPSLSQSNEKSRRISRQCGRFHRIAKRGKQVVRAASGAGTDAGLLKYRTENNTYERCKRRRPVPPMWQGPVLSSEP